MRAAAYLLLVAELAGRLEALALLEAKVKRPSPAKNFRLVKAPILISDDYIMKISPKRSILSPPNPCLCMGIMSGTSADSVDVSVVEISESKASLVEFISEPYPEPLRKRIKKVNDISEVSILNREIGEFFSSVAKKSSKKVFCIGTHGQTVYHHKIGDSSKSTLQLGYPECLARDLGAVVVSDFRIRDIVLGGEGAPLTPYGDLRLFGDDSPKLILNIGGISNVTVLGQGRILGFDVGPGNAPLDRLAHLLAGKDYDAEGSIAASGKIDEDILKELISDDLYIKKAPPKSTGLEAYGDSFVGRIVSQYGLSSNLLTTVTEFIAYCIAESVKSYDGNLILCGGGSQNSYLRSRISERLNSKKVELIDSYGVSWKARESMIFAILAHDMLCGLETSIPSVTGATKGAPLGRITLP